MASSNKSTEMTVRVGVEQVNAAVRSLEELERRIRSILGTTGGSSGGGVPNVGEQFGQRIPSAVSDTKASTMSPLPMFGGGGSGGVGGSPASIVINSVASVVINAASSVTINGNAVGGGSAGGAQASPGAGVPTAPTGSQQAQQGGGGGGGGTPPPPNSPGMGGAFGNVLYQHYLPNAYRLTGPIFGGGAGGGGGGAAGVAAGGAAGGGSGATGALSMAEASLAIFAADQALRAGARGYSAIAGMEATAYNRTSGAIAGGLSVAEGRSSAQLARMDGVYSAGSSIPIVGFAFDVAKSWQQRDAAKEQFENQLTIQQMRFGASGAGRRGVGNRAELLGKMGQDAIEDSDKEPVLNRFMAMSGYAPYGFFNDKKALRAANDPMSAVGYMDLMSLYSGTRGDVAGGAAFMATGAGSGKDITRRSRLSDIFEGQSSWLYDDKTLNGMLKAGFNGADINSFKGLAVQVSELQRTSTMGGYAASIGQSQLSGLTAFGATPQEKIAALQATGAGMQTMLGAEENKLELAKKGGADETKILQLTMAIESLKAAIKENIRSQNDLTSATRSSIASSRMTSAQVGLQRGLISEGANSGAWDEYGKSASEVRASAEAYLARPDIQRDPAQRAQAQAAVDQAKYSEWQATVQQPALASSAEAGSFYSRATAEAQAKAMTAGFGGGIEGGLSANLGAASATGSEGEFEIAQANDLRARGLISPSEHNARISSASMKVASGISQHQGAILGAAGGRIALSGNVAQTAGAKFGAYTSLTGTANTVGMGRESMGAQFGYAAKFGEQADWLQQQGAHADTVASMRAQGEQAYYGSLAQAGSFQFAPSTGIRSGMAQNQLGLQAVTSLNSVQGSARPLLENQMGLLRDALGEMTETFKGKKSAIMSQPIDPSGKGGGFRTEADRKAALESLSAGFAESKSQLGGQMISAQAQLEQGMLDKVLSAQYGQSSMSPLLMSQFSKRESGLFSDVWSQYFGGNQKSIASARGRGSQLVGSFFGNTETQAGIEDTIAGGVAGKNINLGGEVTFRIQLEDLNGNKMYDNKHVVNASQMTPSKQVGPTQR